jgi:hypothetical protein
MNNNQALSIEYTPTSHPVEPGPETSVQVTITVSIAGETKEFDADAVITSDAFFVAGGLLSGLTDDAWRWMVREGRARREPQ